MTDEETASAEALRGEYEQLEQAHAGADELPTRQSWRHGSARTAMPFHAPRATNGLGQERL
jgi:ParB family chromosome partitioning protein